MEQSSANIYVSLQRLVWSTFVGVISFQIIAPNVWNYVNKMLGIQYQAGYTIFVIIYAVTLPIIILIWLRTHRLELKACLFPIDKVNETTRLCTVFIRGLALTISLQLTTVFILLLCYSVAPYLFVTIQLLLLGLSLTLLGFGAVISWERIRCFAKENKDTLSIKVKNKACRILVTWILLAISLVAFGVFHWAHNSKYYAQEKEKEVCHSFLMLQERDCLDSMLRDARTYHTAVLYKKSNLNLETIGKQKIDSLTKIDLDKAYANALSFLPKVDLLQKDSIKRLDSVYLQIDNVLVARKDLTLKKAQSGLGKRLRDNQLKITYLLLNVFLMLISLYVFLKADFIIKDHQHEVAKRLFGLYPNSFEFKTETTGKEDKKNESMRISGDIWLYITIAIWLLVPLFKPIEDSKIDTTAPFKMLTFGNGVDRFIGNTSNDENVRINNSFNNTTNLDTLLLQIQRRFDVDVITTADLGEMKVVLDTINIRTQKMKIKDDSISLRTRKIREGANDIKKRVRTLVPEL